MSLQFYNTLSKEKENFSPINSSEVLMYTCGPTVYDFAHIGNLRSYVFADIVKKTLNYNGFNVKQVMNITDIGHLSSDMDTGEDKMTKGLLREGKELTLANMRNLAEFYTEKFKEDLKKLNIEFPSGLYFASDYIKEYIELIEKINTKGYTYKTKDGIYFNTSKVKDYGILFGGIKNKDQSQSRIELNSEKINSEDFALWKLDSKIGFDSPWGTGFPGWHIECSAMSMKFLGEQFDIHTGGIDHIPVHHTNEIAQSESASQKKPFVKYWMHHEHINIENGKMAKSEGNFIKLSNIIERGINPISYRLWLLMGNYQTKMNFTWESLEGADTALKKLQKYYLSLGKDFGEINKEYQLRFKTLSEDNIDTPKMISLMWELIKDNSISEKDKKSTLLDFDKILSLGLNKIEQENLDVPENIILLAENRVKAKKEKDFKKSDELRKEINSLGYNIIDNGNDYFIEKL